MDPEVVSQIVGIIGIAIATAVGLLLKTVANMAVKALEAKIGKDNFEWAKSTVETLVRGIEQSPFAKEFDGARKKEMVLAQIQTWLMKKGITLDPMLVDQMIEAAVQAMQSVGETVTIVGE